MMIMMKNKINEEYLDDTCTCEIFDETHLNECIR